MAVPIPLCRYFSRVLTGSIYAVFDSYEIWGGVPAKFIKKADPAQTEEINKTIANNYAMYASWYKE